MADWLKVQYDLWEHPNAMAIAQKLFKGDIHAAVGRLARVWAWAQERTTNGRVANARPEMIDALVGAQGFSSAMRSVGWLEVGESWLVFPRWKKHNGSGAKSRALAAQRMSRSRSRNVARAAQHKRTKRAPEQEQEEKRIKTPPTPSPGATGRGAEPNPAAAAIAEALAKAGVSESARAELAASCLELRGVTTVIADCQRSGKGPGVIVTALRDMATRAAESNRKAEARQQRREAFEQLTPEDQATVLAEARRRYPGMAARPDSDDVLRTTAGKLAQTAKSAVGGAA